LTVFSFSNVPSLCRIITTEQHNLTTARVRDYANSLRTTGWALGTNICCYVSSLNLAAGEHVQV